MKLYHYVHCPFCVRVRMGLGYLGVNFDSIVLPYDDEITPVKLTGKKMLPIVQLDNGKNINESLDILKIQDTLDRLNWQGLTNKHDEINELLDKLGAEVHSLAMPYWIWTPEFSETSRQYFQSKKEIKRGPFKDLVKKRSLFTNKLQAILENELSDKLTPFYQSSTLTILDIMIASHLWGMYIVPEFQFSQKVHAYLQAVKEQTKFNYHEDFWS